MRNISIRSKVSVAVGAVALTLLVPAASEAGPLGTGAAPSVATAAQSAAAPAVNEMCEPGQDGVIYGTNAKETVSGTSGDDVICALGGDDRVEPGGGDDIVYGGDGNDELVGGEGDDTLDGEAGNDSLTGGNGNDSLSGGDGNDSHTGGEGDDHLNGWAGNDTLAGGEGNDRLVGDVGDDTLLGQGGNDVLRGDDGIDTADGHTGQDTCEAEQETRCEQGMDSFDPYSTPTPLNPGHSAPPMEFTVDGLYDGVEVQLETNGGIYPWDVKIEPADEYTRGRLGAHMPGGAFDITVPAAAPAFRSGTLTLPYNTAHLGGYAEEDLRVFWFDPSSQLWLPASDSQIVDTERDTVTTPVEHFSVYAVLSMTSEGWESFFSNAPVRCVSGNDPHTRVDATMLIDTSGSMSSEDPQGLRVDGAKLFVEGMRDHDRAAVVNFSSSATTRIGLTSLSTPENRAAVATALEQTRFASGGTSISAAVQRAISIFDAVTDESVQVAVLMTDGQSSYSSSLTTQAAQLGIEIHTVGLGPGVNSALLQGIADGTGGTYQHLTNPQNLPALYAQLVGDLIDDGTDTDGDTITDCVERNGMFSPILSTLYDDADAEFVTTNPDAADTDRAVAEETGEQPDFLADNEEMLAYEMADYPEVAAEYSFLVEKGLTRYYVMRSDPNKPDSDGDGVDDGSEVAAGTDPLVRDDQRLGIDDLDLPASALFQPAEENHAYPAIPFSLQVHDQQIFKQTWSSNTAVYGEEDGEPFCSGDPCDPVWDYVYAWDNDDSLFCVNMVGFCENDWDQLGEIIDRIRVAQGIWDADGEMRGEYVLKQSYYLCVTWANQADCDRALTTVGDLPSGDSTEAMTRLNSVPVALPQGVPGIRISTDWARKVADFMRANARAISAGLTAVVAVELVKSCYEQASIDTIDADASDYRHPCDTAHMYAPGKDVPEAAQHKWDAIRSLRHSPVLKYRSQAEQRAKGLPSGWYTRVNEACNDQARAAAQAARPDVLLQCDEYPYYASDKAGPGAALRFIRASDNFNDGLKYKAFTRGCPPVSAAPVEADRDAFLIVPNMIIDTAWVC